MKAETLSFKRLSPELEELLAEKMVTIKGGNSDGGFDWQEFYDTHDQGTYHYEDGDFQLSDNENQPIIVEVDGYDKISFDGGDTWGTLIGDEDQVTITGLYNDIVFEAEQFYAWASDNNNFNYEDFWENLGYGATLGELVSEGLNNIGAVKAFGYLGNITDAAGVVMDWGKLIDYYKEQKGNMDAVRFSIHVSGTTTSIMAASAYGGPEGILIGTGVSTVGEGMEWVYDTIHNVLSEMQGEFNNNFSNGWLPSR